MTEFFGLPSATLENDFLRLEYLTNAGPRIVRLSLRGGANLLAELPDTVAKTPLGDYRFYGGHRLWRAPEMMPATYVPDNSGLEIEQQAGSVLLTQRVAAGISKSIAIRLDPQRAAVTLTHRLWNASSEAVSLAPWALTMLRLGGVGIFPQPVGAADPDGLLSNRLFVLWPYTRFGDERLEWGDDFVLLRASAQLPPVKLGYFNPHGWMGYYLDGALFVKRFRPAPGLPHPDQGCNSETFCNNRFIELESLGPLCRLQPGEEVTHDETWEAYAGLDPAIIPPPLAGRILQAVRG